MRFILQFAIFLAIAFSNYSLGQEGTYAASDTNNSYTNAYNACHSAANALGIGCGYSVDELMHFYTTASDNDGNSYRWDNSRCATLHPSYINCVEHKYFFTYDDTCPAGTLADTSTGFCGPDCQPGSLSPDCAVYCPLQDYTYTLNGVVFRGKVGGGTVGYGQSCPDPSYPDGSQAGCVGDVGTCGEDWDNGVNDGVTVTTEETTTETTENPDGSSTTTETTTTNETGGTSATGGSTGSTDGKVVDEHGIELTAGEGGTGGGWDGTEQNTIDIGNQTYGVCGHGGIVSSDGGCDYPSHNCSSTQIDSASGCIDLPSWDLPGGNTLPEEPPTTTTTTNTDPEGNSVTTTTTIPGDDGTGTGTSPGEGDAVDTPSTGTSSGDCSIPPVSTGDAQLDAILKQNWELLCAGETFVGETMGDLGAEITAAQDELVSLIDAIKTDISNTIGVNISANGSCSENIVQIFGVPMNFSVCRFLPYFVIAGNVLLAMAAFISFRIIMS